MRFKIDENLPRESAELFAQAGHDATTVVTQKMVGTADRKLATVCKTERRALVTLDLDFSDARTFPPDEYHGIIVLRPGTQTKSHVLNLLKLAVRRLKTEKLVGKLWIVDEAGIRIRQSE